MKRSNWKVALSFVCAAFAISASAEASGEKEFRDATGAVVTTMPQSTYDSFSGVRNKETSDPADGSQVARVSHPGIMFPYNGNEVVVMQVDDQGALVTPGANGFVAHVSVTDADGLVYDNGESLPASVFVESGIFKNPGPDSLAVMVVVGAESEIRTIAPGDGLVINGNDDSIIIQRQFVVLDSEGNIALTMQAKRRCSCTCTVNSVGFDYTIDCPGCESELGENDGCCCDKDDDAACDVGGSEGTVSGCTKVIYLRYITL